MESTGTLLFIDNPTDDTLFDVEFVYAVGSGAKMFRASMLLRPITWQVHHLSPSLPVLDALSGSQETQADHRVVGLHPFGHRTESGVVDG